MQAFNIAITAITLIPVGFIFCDFLLGLGNLWEASNPQLKAIASTTMPAAIPTPQLEPVSDPWLLPTAPIPAKPNMKMKVNAPVKLLLLPPAKENSAVSIEKPSVNVSNSLQLLGIRELKKRASEARVKNYSNMTKSQLIKAILGKQQAA